MRIALDAMGGDFAPDAIIDGVIDAQQHLDADDQVILVGPTQTIQARLAGRTGLGERISIVEAPEVIGMDEPPVESLRAKPKSSIAVLAKLAKQGQTDAVISAGNTGACVAAFQMRMRNLPGVNRPGIGVVVPTFGGPVVICDVGANIACKPINLYQYAIMASVYSSRLLGKTNPKIGLLSIGQEDTKGNELIRKARVLIKSDPDLNLYGNVEGRDIFKAVVDVVICDGFVGNVVLKLSEGLVDGLFNAIKDELMREEPQLALTFKPIVKRIYQKYDYNEYGGAPLLGVNGTALICHGASQARTIRNAILAAKRYHQQRINAVIADYLQARAQRMSDAQTN
ncbi:MAG: phosphate acyltransferase PlsX [Sedimentisphaerales bacterium]|jgi:glycerol-3-phosphate acyltransferase PlsX|nr:phosphate acyltransferase PlsX [Sedimentisphaerales bacterium]